MQNNVRVSVLLAISVCFYSCVAPQPEAISGNNHPSACAPLLVASLPGKWVPIPELTDEFEGTKLDEAKWHNHNPKWLGRKPGFFSTENVEVRDGKLHLTARKEEPPAETRAKGYHTFTTAAVQSKTKVLYGYFETKCKPMKSHASSAFWFYQIEPNMWTEIDVFEIGGGASAHRRKYHMNAHVFRTLDCRGTAKNHLTHGQMWEAPYDLADEYHVYGLEWNKTEIKWYVDGEVIRTLDNKYWHQPLYMNFDSETMPTWFGLSRNEELPATFSVEYIRSWKIVDHAVPDASATADKLSRSVASVPRE